MIWVSGLRNPIVQAGVRDLLAREEVAVVITGTSFASVRQEDAGLGSPPWEQLDRPVLQLLCSSRTKATWESSSRGLDPLDLSLQVVMPELDGRITTRPCAFRDLQADPNGLATAIPTLVPDGEGLDWVVEHARRWGGASVDPSSAAAGQPRSGQLPPSEMVDSPTVWDWTPPPPVSPS